MINRLKFSRLFKICRLKLKLSNICEFLKKLMDLKTSPKPPWSLLKTNLSNKKTPCIIPTFLNNKSISNFRDKAWLFNNFFVRQCTLLDITNEIPTTLKIEKTNTLSSIPVTRDNIAKIIKTVDSNKPKRHNTISIWTLKLCGTQSCNHYNFFSNPVLKVARWPQNGKKANVVPMNKKGCMFLSCHVRVLEWINTL